MATFCLSIFLVSDQLVTYEVWKNRLGGRSNSPEKGPVETQVLDFCSFKTLSKLSTSRLSWDLSVRKRTDDLEKGWHQSMRSCIVVLNVDPCWKGWATEQYDGSCTYTRHRYIHTNTLFANLRWEQKLYLILQQVSHAMAGDGDDGGTRTVTKTVTPSGSGHLNNIPDLSRTVW